MRLYHKGTLTAEAGVLFWAAALVMASLRGHGYLIAEIWIVAGLVIGLLLIVWGIAWEMRTDLIPVSEQALTTLHWFALHCSHAADLLQRNPHPTWAEAFHIESLCRKKARRAREQEYMDP
uniref:Uncharacterized protein n=1 Tax=mine drainage metagenome TaxID=410659 RepID=E6QM05_9ZZZZ